MFHTATNGEEKSLEGEAVDRNEDTERLWRRQKVAYLIKADVTYETKQRALRAEVIASVRMCIKDTPSATHLKNLNPKHSSE